MELDRAARIWLVSVCWSSFLPPSAFASAIIAPVTFALFIIAIVWPLQSALQKRIPKLLALVVTLLITVAVIAVLISLVIWGLAWSSNGSSSIRRGFKTLYLQATDSGPGTRHLR